MKISFNKEITQPREVVDGAGRHFPHLKDIIPYIDGKERLLLVVNRKLSIIAIDEDSDGITGKIEIKTSGRPEALADWMQNK